MAFKSLRTQLLAWLLLPLAAAAVVDGAVTYRNALETSNAIQERMLVGAARVIGEQAQWEDGIMQVVIPPSALELFQSLPSDRVFYRVTFGGRLLSGYYDLALPDSGLRAEEVRFGSGTMRGAAVRSVAFAQPVFAAPGRQTVLIQVAQTLNGRDQLAREMWLSSVRSQLLVLVLVAGLVLIGLRGGLRPVIRLRDRILSRRPGTTGALDDEGVPSELRPLVAALNDYASRLDRQMSAHSQFIANASHQLRTPFTLLNTQVEYALRHETDSESIHTIREIHKSVQHGIRVVRQLLALVTAEGGRRGAAQVLPKIELVEVVKGAVESLASLAQRRSIDLGFESNVERVTIEANPDLVHELVSNLLDNALRYTPSGGAVTARVSASAYTVAVDVEDNGPGIPPSERQRVFERFYRLASSDSDGCGLGLAIVREIAEGCAASVTLDTPASGIGLIAHVEFPLAHDAAPVADAPLALLTS